MAPMIAAIYARGIIERSLRASALSHDWLQPQHRLRPVAAPQLPAIAPRFEDFTPASHLRVLRVFDFQPGRRHAIVFVSALAPFADECPRGRNGRRRETVPYRAGAKAVLTGRLYTARRSEGVPLGLGGPKPRAVDSVEENGAQLRIGDRRHRYTRRVDSWSLAEIGPRLLAGLMLECARSRDQDGSSLETLAR